MSSSAARQIHVSGARALAHADGLESVLGTLLDSVAEHIEAGSAAIVIVDGPSGRRGIAASFGLPDAARAGLATAIGNARHPIAKTVATPVATFDALPAAPGGPALRSHLPLTVAHDGRETVLGVLALAHDRPIEPAMRPILEAAPDLAAVAIELHRTS